MTNSGNGWIAAIRRYAKRTRPTVPEFARAVQIITADPTPTLKIKALQKKSAAATARGES